MGLNIKIIGDAAKNVFGQIDTNGDNILSAGEMVWDFGDGYKIDLTSQIAKYANIDEDDQLFLDDESAARYKCDVFEECRDLKMLAFQNTAKEYARNFIPGVINFFHESAEAGIAKAKRAGASTNPLVLSFWTVEKAAEMSVVGFIKGVETCYSLERAYVVDNDPIAGGEAAFLIPVILLSTLMIAGIKNPMTKLPRTLPSGGGQLALAGAVVAINTGVLVKDGLLLTGFAMSTGVREAGDSQAVKVKGREGSTPRVSDDALAAALRETGGNRSRAAKRVGLTQLAVSKRISRAEAGSPLAEFKRWSRISDEELAAALRETDGNQSKAMAKVGLSQSYISLRIRSAEAGSPLARFKGVSKK